MSLDLLACLYILLPCLCLLACLHGLKFPKFVLVSKKSQLGVGLIDNPTLLTVIWDMQIVLSIKTFFLKRRKM